MSRDEWWTTDEVQPDTLEECLVLMRDGAGEWNYGVALWIGKGRGWSYRGCSPGFDESAVEYWRPLERPPHE